MKKDVETLNTTDLARLIKFRDPSLKLKDIQKVLNLQSEVIAYGLDKEQRIKIGKLFIIEPTIRPSHKHYRGMGKGSKYVTVPKRLRFKFKALKQLKEIEDSHQY